MSVTFQSEDGVLDHASAVVLFAAAPTVSAERLAAAESETDRLGQIIEGLLQLSRAEASSVPAVTVDLAVLARERITHWQPLAHEHQVTITYSGPASTLVTAVPTAVEQIIDNYVDNALSVSPANSHIVVSVVNERAGSVLSVSDEGPGLSGDECVRAFDRFWRASSETPGSGLGLAIVTQLATASSATVELRPRLPHGLEARAIFAPPRG